MHLHYVQLHKSISQQVRRFLSHRKDTMTVCHVYLKMVSFCWLFKVMPQIIWTFEKQTRLLYLCYKYLCYGDSKTAWASLLCLKVSVSSPRLCQWRWLTIKSACQVKFMSLGSMEATKGLGTPHRVTPHCTLEGEQYCSELNLRPHVISSRDYNSPLHQQGMLPLRSHHDGIQKPYHFHFALISFSLTDVLQGFNLCRAFNTWLVNMYQGHHKTWWQVYIWSHITFCPFYSLWVTSTAKCIKSHGSVPLKL